MKEILPRLQSLLLLLCGDIFYCNPTSKSIFADNYPAKTSALDQFLALQAFSLSCMCLVTSASVLMYLQFPSSCSSSLWTSLLGWWRNSKVRIELDWFRLPSIKSDSCQFWELLKILSQKWRRRCEHDICYRVELNTVVITGEASYHSILPLGQFQPKAAQNTCHRSLKDPGDSAVGIFPLSSIVHQSLQPCSSLLQPD